MTAGTPSCRMFNSVPQKTFFSAIVTWIYNCNMAVSESHCDFVLERQGQTVQTMNAINLIVPYRYQGMWVFDDARVGLDKEPFVSGADTMIDVLVGDIPNAQKGFRLLFSATPFPGYKVKLEWKREEYGGNWYFSPDFKMEGWLCPALFKYFEKAPREIYVKAEPKG